MKKEKQTSDKLLKGCAIGCGAFLLIVILAAVGLYTYISHKVRNVEELDRITTEVENSFGKADNFIPYHTDFIPADRMETFLKVRDSLVLNSQEFIEAVQKMSNSIEVEVADSQDTSIWEVFDIMKSGIGLIPHLLDHYYKRSYWLREYKMGFGEYYYLYILSYYSFLKNSPSDGPGFQFSENKKFETQHDQKDIMYGEKVLEEREIFIRKKSNQLFRKYFSNLLSSSGFYEENYRNVIELELQNLTSSLIVLPWENELPLSIKNSLEPFRTRLENSYEPMLNPLEFKHHDDFE